MRSPTLRRVFSLLFILAAVALTSSGLSAQEGARVWHRELVASGAPILYDAIAALHPDWLPPGGASRVAVFVNGAYRGDANVLRNLSADSAASVQRETPGYAAHYLRRYPAGTFDSVILVMMRASAAAAVPRGRFTASFHVGVSVAAISSSAQQGMEGAGYDAPFIRYRESIVGFKNPGRSVPVAVGGSINYRMRDRWGIALTGQHTRAAWAGAFKPVAPPVKAISTTATTSEGAVLVTVDQSVLRLGVGPVFQRVDWEWASAPCQCSDLSATKTSSAGAAGEIVMSIPVARVPVRPNMRVFGRYYPEKEIEAGATGERLQVGGFMMTIGVGLSTHF